MELKSEALTCVLDSQQSLIDQQRESLLGIKRLLLSLLRVSDVARAIEVGGIGENFLAAPSL